MRILEFIFWISLFIIFYTYLGYGILLYLLVKIKECFHRTVIPEQEGGLPEVTLFIAAYNEEAVVAEKMNNTLSLDYPKDKLRIMWVTDGSNDRTGELLSAYPGVDVLHQPQRSGKTAALNRGMA